MHAGMCMQALHVHMPSMRPQARGTVLKEQASSSEQ